MPRILKITTLAAAALALLAAAALAGDEKPKDETTKEKSAVTKNDDQWKQELSPEQYKVLRCSATEAPFTGQYYDHHETGTYLCAGCGAPLFSSSAKYESGSGWPSYFQPINDAALRQKKDLSGGMVRVEITCAKCGGHLGHLFPDGPKPTGMRYCINSAALDFRKAEADPK